LELRLRKLTKTLQAGETSCSKERAKILLQLRLPELAAGGTWRALQLVDRNEREPVTLLLGQAPLLANAFLECINVVDSITATAACVDWLSLLRNFAKAAYVNEQADAADGDSNQEVGEEATDGDRFGEVDPQAYPWIPSSRLRWDTYLTQSLNSEPNRVSKGQCEVSASGIFNTGSDCFGIFTRRSIPAKNTLFIVPTAISATCDTVQQCNDFGGELSSTVQSHGVLCGRAMPDLDPWDDMVGPIDPDTQDKATWR
jgi:hypothetical protein